MIQLKRAYEGAAPSDGYRVLVDRLWPRGVRKDAAHLDAWLKELAPSDALRRWFGHDPERFPEFEKRYERELRTAEARALLDELAERAATSTVTLVYAAHDQEHNQAVVLAHEIARRLGAGGRARSAAEAPKKTAAAKARAAKASDGKAAGAKASDGKAAGAKARAAKASGKAAGANARAAKASDGTAVGARAAKASDGKAAGAKTRAAKAPRTPTPRSSPARARASRAPRARANGSARRPSRAPSAD